MMNLIRIPKLILNSTHSTIVYNMMDSRALAGRARVAGQIKRTIGVTTK